MPSINGAAIQVLAATATFVEGSKPSGQWFSVADPAPPRAAGRNLLSDPWAPIAGWEYTINTPVGNRTYFQSATTLHVRPPLPQGCVPESNGTLIDKYPTSFHIEYPNCTWPNGTESPRRVVVSEVGPDEYYKDGSTDPGYPELRCTFSNTSRFDEYGQPVPVRDEPTQPYLGQSFKLILANCPVTSEAASLTPNQAAATALIAVAVLHL